MKHLRSAWQYVLGEPFTWLFYCFFQPTRFRKECESQDFLKRMLSMLRLVLPIFLCSYPFALGLQIIIGAFERNLPVPIVVNSMFRPDSVTGMMYFLLAIALVSVVSIVLGVLWGITEGLTGGIAWSLVLSITGGTAIAGIGASPLGVSGFVGTLARSTLADIEIIIIAGSIGGFIGGISGFLTKEKNIRKNIIERIIGGIVGGIVGDVLGISMGIILENIARTSSVKAIGEASIILRHLADTASIAGIIIGGITRPTVKKQGRTRFIVGGIVGGTVGAIGGLRGDLFKTPPVSSIWEVGIIVVGSVGVGIIVGIIAGTILDHMRTYNGRKSNMAGLMMLLVGILLFVVYYASSAMSIVLAIVLGMTLGIVRPPIMSILLAILLAVGGVVNPASLTWESIQQSLLVDLVLIVCYILGYYRVPLYPVSSLSSFRAYLASRKNPLQVFTYLHHCSLYWDERASWLLPGLKRTLLIAAGQSIEQTLEEVSFIVAERPQQIEAARAASLEIAIRDLEMRENLREIAQAAQRLTGILPQEAGLVDPHWVTPFARLSDASRDAARACSPLGWQARRTALQEMIGDLKKVYPNVAFTDAHLNTRLGEVVRTWLAVAQRELEEMERAPERTSRIENPYNPGPALELRDSLFVGRRDLAQQLGDALGRGNRRPTFLLQGERRMGKSSTLKQLPDLLGAKYLPIFYDLQTRGFSSSIAVFLGKIADEIYKVMRARGLPAKKLAYERLQEASQKNDAQVYHLFERWLEEVEGTLEQEERTLLLTFDEFEKLEEAGRDGYLNLGLLLDWFRSVIQNHPRLALLFSGVRSFGDMGTNWTGYFVNVQTLKIGFLQPAEAYQLITRPVSNFPSEQIFGERVVEGIIRVTNCHPFLVQAICSALLDSLNADKRNRTELPDVGVAANQVLKNWGSTYFRDLWERTDEDQRICVLILNRLSEGDLLRIEQQSSLDSIKVHRALETLLERDIITCENGIYQIAVPLFGVWVTRGNYR